MLASVKEQMAVFIGRQVKNGDYLSLGTNLPIPTAGVLLANLTHAPDLKINILNYVVNLSHIDRFDDLTQIASPNLFKWAESIMDMEEQFDAVARMDLCFVGGFQVDQYGNVNATGIGAGPDGWKIKGPGGVGTSTVMATVKKFFILINEHSPRVLVRRCDVCTAVGWGQGGENGRRELGLPGGGPEYVISPRGIMDFAPSTRKMRLRYLFPPNSVEDVLAATGFDLEVHKDVCPVAPPEPSVLDTLRQRVDPKGYLRL